MKDEKSVLQAARDVAMARAAKRPAPVEEPQTEELDTTQCMDNLTIAMFLTGLKMGMGVMPDGMAVYVRLAIPADSDDGRAGHVAFLVGQDALSVLNKAILALDAKAPSRYWQPDRYARSSS